MTGKLKDLTVNRDGTQNITVTVDADFTETFDALKDKSVTVEIKKASKARSLDANRFCWALCRDIGRAMTPPVSDKDIYRLAIEKVGVYWQKDDVPAFKVDEMRRIWESNGEGWLFKVIDDSPGKPGRKLVHLYFGSSCYTVDAMRVLLDWLVDQAQQMQLPIPLSKTEEENLLKGWGENGRKNAVR